MDQPTPVVSPDDILRLIRRDFPGDQVETVVALLARYGSQSHEPERHRVHAAILKLANGDLEVLERQVSQARMDYRDTLAPAEYPEYMRKVPGPNKVPDDERERIIAADWRQYKQWFDR